MTRRLSISIEPDGRISAVVSGTPGPACLDALEQLRRMLDADVTDSRPTPEFSASAATVDMHLDADNEVEDLA